MKKSKNQSPGQLCVCTRTSTLSPKAAAQILGFLEAFTDNFVQQYGRQIDRYYAKRAKRNINVHKPWKGNCTGELF